MQTESLRRPENRSSFTLIELLVVITILAILAALLLPSLGRGKAMARKTACLNRTRQIGIALNLYTEDNSQWYPVDNIYTPPQWTWTLKSYWGDTDDTPHPLKFLEDPGMPSETALTLWWHSHYTANMDLVSRWNGSGNPRLSYKKDRVTVPDQTMIITCGTTLRIFKAWHLTNSPERIYSPHPSYTHNVLFVDQHVESWSRNDLPLDKNDVFWKPDYQL
ncbi:MAG: prepilin-type N-terminal cleavage/methylation domain-containing protein [Lentisphaerae bacterium]|nr:MAG: prepilin-type N-terminal cleavage/methylation domain-containing protein [Lentisphaerota bacterium]